ncbi:hypothetical protein H4219_001328 [Mycoemilia scoparia]|uniref:Uncharacterized protein n=1 Tax=Mycoemilia scoparia TaxID=417184 RepID=A0A9W8A9P0_9FUNG|nr:hypothetical protein H4219_001328 [Mycoemilia scoparia]
MRPEEIRQIRIPVVRISSQPGHFIEYAVQVQGPVRSWTVWHRYSEFSALHSDFGKQFPGQQIPFKLPPKAVGGWLNKLNPFSSHHGTGSEGSEKKGYMEPIAASKISDEIEHRRHDLEQYLRSIYYHENNQWRNTKVWKDFLTPPGNTLITWAGGNSNAFGDEGNGKRPETFATPQSWLEDYRDADKLTRDIRELLWRRESALSRNEVSTSHQCTLQAKRLLNSLEEAIGELGASLKVLTDDKSSSPALSKGESLRRQDKLRAISEEKVKLSKLIIGDSGEPISSSRLGQFSEVKANSANKNELLKNDRTGFNANNSGAKQPSRIIASASFGSTDSGRSNSPMSHNFNSDSGSTTKGKSGWRSKRIFGNSNRSPSPPQETDMTRTMDNQEVLQLQTTMMDTQDKHVASLSHTLQRQREIGLSIGQELEMHNQLLDELSEDIDRTGNKLNAAKRQINRIK